jgi:hypothetical protein
MTGTWMIDESLTNTNPIIALPTFNGKTAATIQENLNSFADNLEQIFTTNSEVGRDFTVSTEQVVNDFLEQPLTDRMRATNHSEVAWLVRHLKPRKAAGPGGIQSIMFQHSQIYCQTV